MVGIEIHQQPEPEPEPEGAVIRAIPSLNGKTVKLIRGGQEVIGVLLSKDKQGPSKNLSFQWKDKNGSVCVGDVTQEEVEKLLNGE